MQDGWNREATPMTRNEFGVWEVILPAKDGQPAIPHNTKVKVGRGNVYQKLESNRSGRFL